MKHTRSLALLAALLAPPACSTATVSGPSRAALLSDAPASPNRPCRVAPEPARLPAAAELVDSAALSAAAAQVWRAAGAPPGYVLVAMGYDREGVNIRRDLLEYQVPRPLADTLQKLVFAHRRPMPRSRAEWGVRLRLDLGGQPVLLRVGRRELCAAHPRDARAAGPGLGGTSFGDVREREAPAGMLPLVGMGPVWVRVTLDAGGNVTDARLVRGLARATTEWRVLSYVRAISFVPATEDGWPVPAELTFRLYLGR